jgi:hypothetical protein
MTTILKDDRIKMLEDTIYKIDEMAKFYKRAYPAWILLHQAKNFITSVSYIETQSNSEKDILGVNVDEK